MLLVKESSSGEINLLLPWWVGAALSSFGYVVLSWKYKTDAKIIYSV